MGTSPIHPSSTIDDDDEWDADGFVIPSFTVGQAGLAKLDEPALSKQQESSPKEIIEEKIYLGPHGAPPHVKQQRVNLIGRKQRLKHKLKDADKKFSGTGRENKVDNLRELVGDKVAVTMPMSSLRDWLDPHCHESQFEKSR